MSTQPCSNIIAIDLEPHCLLPTTELFQATQTGQQPYPFQARLTASCNYNYFTAFYVLCKVQMRL